MGTPEIAASALRTLYAAGLDICGVFTQPDKPKGRGMILSATPVGDAARELGIDVYQPKSMRKSLTILESLQIELVVVVAYGRILPDDILNFPKYGCINLHASLLPKYRGAAPIQYAVMNGDSVGGVSTMYMAADVDAGDIIYTERTPITPEDTAGTLSRRYAEIGGPLLVKTIRDIEAGIVPRNAQDHTLATFTKPITREDAKIDWTTDAETIRCRIMGLDPAPIAFTTYNGSILKIYRAEVCGESGKPGEVLAADKNGLKVAAGNGSLLITELQPAGRKRMAAADYLRGHLAAPGSLLGGE
jgi:methionyl-tRNA formyltransferase